MLYSALVRPPPGVLNPALVPPPRKEHGTVGANSKFLRGLEHFHLGDRLRNLGLFSLEKRIFCGYLLATFQYLKGAHSEEKRGLFQEL